jgi:Rap1a immunity proteins
MTSLSIRHRTGTNNRLLTRWNCPARALPSDPGKIQERHRPTGKIGRPRCVVPLARAAEVGTGNALIESCRSLLDPEYNPVSNLQQNLDNAPGIVAALSLHESRGMCLGMVGAVRDFMAVQRGAAPGVKLACIPYNVPNGELVRVVVHFMDQHPESLHLRLPTLAIAALAQARPCH